MIDLPDRLDRLVNGGDKWHSHLAKFDAVELRHEAVAHRLCGYAGLIGYKKHSSLYHGSLHVVGARRRQSVSLNPASGQQAAHP